LNNMTGQGFGIRAFVTHSRTVTTLYAQELNMTTKPIPPDEKADFQRLFAPGLPARKWIEFSAPGYSVPVSGAIFSADQPPCCGVPLGGVSTGCLDIDPRGVFGYSSLFNPGGMHPVFESWRYPRKNPTLQPFLGVSVGGQTWVLAAPEMASGEPVQWCTEPQMQITGQGRKITEPVSLPTPRLKDVQFAERITYWGHYPIADMEFESGAPVSVGLRAWAPFIPGDATASNLPAAVFEVHLRNPGGKSQTGTLAFSFLGPDAQEARSTEFTRQEVHEDFRSVLVSSPGEVQYLLGVMDADGPGLGEAKIRFGSGLHATPQAWSQIDKELPQPPWRRSGGEVRYLDGSCSAAVDFELAPGAEKVVRFLLAWYAPILEGGQKSWKGQDAVGDGFLRVRWIGSEQEGERHFFTHMYAYRFNNALDVARSMAAQHTALLKRVLAWQECIYADQALPAWLRDALINNLALIAEDSYWFQPKPPLGDWVFPLGAFAMNESPRGCPHMSCTPCDWYGNLPIVFFFPELAHSTLKLFKQYQHESGEIPFAIGKIADLPDMATPEFYWQVSLNGMCYIDMVDRLWQRTGDIAILKEFYPSVKRCNTFTMDLRKGPGGPISFPEIGGMEWFEFGDWAGMAAHLGGLRLAELRMVERMAQAMGDSEYAQACRAWYADGSRAMEEEMWAERYYLNYYEKETGKRSDDVMAYQLDGEWTARYHGLEGVFQPERVLTTLETIQRCNMALSPEMGAANFTRPDGSPLPADSKVAVYGQYAMFTPEVVLLGMTYLYAGQREVGLELVRKYWENVCLKQGHNWDLPNMIHGDSGKRVFGTDYYQNMMLWALPAALAGQDLRAACASGGLIQEIVDCGLLIED
jgi:uncharacterized protein (DUF608 family)